MKITKIQTAKAKKTLRRSRPDDDNPELTAEDFKRAKRFDQLPRAMQDGLRAIMKRGRPPLAAPKKQISLRLDAGLVDHLKQRGGYNAQIETMLIKAWKEQRI